MRLRTRKPSRLNNDERAYLAASEALIEDPIYGIDLREQARALVGRGRLLADVVRPALAAPGTAALEIGVGYLFSAIALRRHIGDHFDLYAIEKQTRAIWQNPQFAEKAAELGLEVRPYDLESGDAFPYQRAFDAVVFADVIEHLPRTVVLDVLTLLSGLLAPGGRLVITSPNLAAFYRIISLTFGRGEIFDPPWLIEGYGFYGHIHLYGHADMERLLERVGLRIIEWRYTDWESVFAPPRIRPVQRAVAKVVPRFASSWMLAAVRA